MSLDKGSIALPPPSHICGVVKDMDKAIEFISSVFGVGPWLTEEFCPPKDDITVGESFWAKYAGAKFGPVELHLVQPLDNKSLYYQFLETHGEGLHHVAFDVSNWDEMVAHIQKQGGKMLGVTIYRGAMVAGAAEKGIRLGYFDTPGGTVIELVEVLES